MSSKLIEALEEVESILSTWIDHLPPVIQGEAQEAIYKAEAAFAEPLRNCDIGTAAEQSDRFKAFCDAYPLMCGECPFKDFRNTHNDCAIAWAQMPYEEVKK